MTAQEMKLLFAYKSWAVNTIFDALAAMPPDQVMQDMHSSHHSIYGTLFHYVASEKAWLERWTGNPSPTFMKESEAPTLETLRGVWNAVGFESAKFLASCSDKKLQEMFEMKTMKGETFRHIYWHAMLHVVDHCSYHRGQIVGMMRQLGVAPPTTGMINFFRETAKLGKSS